MSDQRSTGDEGFLAGVDSGLALDCFRALANGVDDGVLQLDADGTIVAVNDRILALTGWSHEDLVHGHLDQILDGPSLERIEGEIHRQRDAANGTQGPLECSLTTATDDRILVEIHLTVLQENDGVHGTIGIVRSRADEMDQQDASRTERDLLDRVLEASPVGISALTPEGEIVTLNERAAEIVGTDLDEVTGGTYQGPEWNVYDADGNPLPPEERAFARVVSTGEAVREVETEVERPDGSRVWLSVNGVPVFDSTGELSLVILSYEDITERKERERQIADRTAELETELSEILGRISDAFYALDEDWRFTHLNEQAEDVLGESEDELLDRHVWDVIPDAAKDVFRDEFHAAMDTQQPTSFEYYQQDRDDWFEFNVYPSETGVSIYFRDITERKQTEQELRTSEERFRTIMEQSPFSMQIFDPDGWTIAVNPAWEQLWDAPREELADYNVLQDEQLEAAGVMPYIERAFGGEVVSLPITHYDPAEIGKPGRDRWIEGFAYPLVPDDGESFEVVLVHHDITERKRAEEALREREAQLSVATAAASIGLWTWDIREDVVTADEYLAETYGLDPEDARAGAPMDAFYEPIYEEDREETRAQLEHALETGELAAEYRVHNASGEIRWVVARGEVEYGEDGKPVRMNGAVTDITERKRREHALEESEERYRDLFTSMTEGYCVIEKVDTPPGDPIDFRYVEANPAFEEHSGVSDVVGTTIRESIPGEAQEWFDTYNAVLETGEPVRFERELVTLDRILECYAFPVGDRSNNQLGVLFTDITEHKHRERELQDVRNRMEFALTATDAIVWDWNVEDDEASFYPSEESLYGTTVEDWDDFVSVIHPDDRDRVQQGIEAALETGEPKYEEVRIIRDGEVRWIEAPGQPVTEEGGPTRMIGVARDITERKTYERKLKESNKRLEQFAYAASHDLQEPLRMVSSYLQLIGDRYDSVLDDDGMEFLEYALDGAERMREMIDGLLKYSRVDTEGDPLEPVDLDGVIEDVIDDLQLKIDERDADITIESLPRVQGDRGQLRQVFQNLLNNAIEYSGDEPPRIHVSAERNGRYWTVSVRDEGIGIDGEHADRIFEVFTRLHSRGDHPGTGIGLALCERIIERHGGRIWVDSALGEGSTFSFTLRAVTDS